MFNMSWFEESEIVGTIKIKNGVLGLGLVIDDDGNKWDIHGIFGAAGIKDQQQVVCACPRNQLHPYYYDTSGYSYSLIYQKWEPYLVEQQNI